MVVKLIISGAALALGTYLVLSGMVILGALLVGSLGGRSTALVLGLGVLLPSALGSALLFTGWRAWSQARSR